METKQKEKKKYGQWEYAFKYNKNFSYKMWN